MRLELIGPRDLKPTECHDRQAASDLAEKIAGDGQWITPLLVHDLNLAILDGHHRCQAAFELELSAVPYLVCTYEEDRIKLGSWRDDYRPNPEDVLLAAETGNLFPYKTTRHTAPELPLTFAISLELLKLKSRITQEAYW